MHRHAEERGTWGGGGGGMSSPTPPPPPPPTFSGIALPPPLPNFIKKLKVRKINNNYYNRVIIFNTEINQTDWSMLLHRDINLDIV